MNKKLLSKLKMLQEEFNREKTIYYTENKEEQSMF